MISMFGANLLKIRPQLQLINGKIVPTEKYRGKMQSVLTKYVDTTLQEYNNPDTARCFVTHADADPEVVASIIEHIKSKNIFKEVSEVDKKVKGLPNIPKEYLPDFKLVNTNLTDINGNLYRNIRPVINLVKNIEMIGTGTNLDPYRMVE